MKKILSITAFLTILLCVLSFNAYSQYGIIEMKNGDKFEMATEDLHVEKDKLRYFKEKWERKTTVMGAGAKKLRQEYEAKSRLVSIADIKKIHVQGELLVGKKSIVDFIGVRYIKIKRYYEAFFVITEGTCSLLVKPEDGNAWYSYYVQTGNEEPYKLHRAGTTFGAKFRKKSKKYFAECGPAMAHIESDLKRSTLPKLIEIYNENCAN